MGVSFRGKLVSFSPQACLEGWIPSTECLWAGFVELDGLPPWLARVNPKKESLTKEPSLSREPPPIPTRNADEPGPQGQAQEVPDADGRRQRRSISRRARRRGCKPLALPKAWTEALGQGGFWNYWISKVSASENGF